MHLMVWQRRRRTILKYDNIARTATGHSEIERTSRASAQSRAPSGTGEASL